MTDFSIGTTLKNEFLPSTNPSSPAKTGLIFAQRKLGDKNQLIMPTGNTPMPNLYVPFYLGSYKDGLTALQALKKMGYQYSLGLSYNNTFPKPDVVTVNAGAGLVTLEWHSTTVGVQDLVGQNPTGTITQDTSTASIRSVSVEGNSSYMTVVPVGSSTFNTADPVTVDAILTKQVPNPATSDSVCLAVWAYYQQYITAPKYTSSPDCYVSVSVYGRDASISPTGTAISFVAPTSVTQSGTIAYIHLPISSDNLGLLPTTALGASVVKQGTVTGTYAGYTLTATECVIKVTNASGTFVQADAFTVELDVSANGFKFIDSYEISSACLAFADVNSQTALNSDYPDFVAGVEALQAPDAAKKQKYKFQGYFGTRFTVAGEYPLATLTTPDSTAYVASITLDVNSAYQFSAPGVNAVQHMFMNLSNEFQYYATSGVGAIMNQECSNDITSYPTNMDADQLTGQGWTVFMPSQTGLRYIYNDVNCMQTNGGTVDYEYRYEATMLKVRWLDKALVQVGNITCVNPDGTRKNNNPELIKTLQQNLATVLVEGYNNGDGILGNTDNSVVVTLNSIDKRKLDVAVTTTVVSPNNGLNITAVFVSYTI